MRNSNILIFVLMALLYSCSTPALAKSLNGRISITCYFPGKVITYSSTVMSANSRGNYYILDSKDTKVYLPVNACIVIETK